MTKTKQLEFEGMGRPNPFIKKGTDPRAQEIEFMFRDLNDWLSCEAPEYFDPSFIESIQAQFERTGSLSDKQYISLKNTWNKWVDQNDADPMDNY